MIRKTVSSGSPRLAAARSSSSSNGIRHNSSTTNPRRRRIVAVTGIGSITPLGNNFQDSYDALLQDQSGVTTLSQALEHGIITSNDSEQARAYLAEELDYAKQLPCQVAASVRPSFNDDANNLYNPRTTPRFVQFALRAAQEALINAGLLNSSMSNIEDDGNLVLLSNNKDLIGVSVGSGMSSVREISRASRLQSLRKLSPYFVPNVLSNSASGRVAIQYGLQGPNLCQSTACAASSHAIGDAMRLIQYGQADVMLAGGAESAIDVLSIAGFTRLKALSTSYNETPTLASRPFDKDRDGFVMGEGSTILVLEELQHALERGQPILCLASGYGMSGDGYHITSPHPNGIGAQACMENALYDAELSTTTTSDSSSIYVNAHATSTPKGDEIEAKAIERTFFGGNGNGESDDNTTETTKIKNSFRRVLVSSTKGSTGHLLGAAGAVEAAFTIQALRDKCVPPTLNLQQQDDDDEDAETQQQQQQQQQGKIELVRGESAVNVDDFDVAISNSFGFGGTNACIVFQRWNE